MKSTTLVLLTLLALVFAGPVACKKKQNSLENKLHGAWIIDEDATLAQLPEAERQMAAFSVRMVKIAMVFQPEGKMELHASMMGQAQESDATYKVLREEGDVLIIQMTRTPDEEEGDVDPQELQADMRVTFLEGDRVSITPENEGEESAEQLAKSTLVLRRTTPEELEKSMKAPQEMPSLEELGLDPSMLGGDPDEDLDDADNDANEDGLGDDDAADADDAAEDE